MKLSPVRLRFLTDALNLVLPLEAPADAVLSRYFREQRAIGSQDRAFVAEMVYAVLRRKRSLEHWSGGARTPRALALAACARLGGASVREMAPLLRGDESRWLEGVKADRSPLPRNVELDLPDWLADRLAAQMADDELRRLARALNLPAPLDLRVNTLKTDRETVLRRLAADGIAAEATPFSPFGVRLAEKIALNRHPLFAEGHVEVQDEGSQLISLLMEPTRHDRVVDFCAGAGGKTLALGALMHGHGRLHALDVSERRLANLKPRLARAGLFSVQPLLLNNENDARLKRLDGKIDRVLVDAPCSGLGTLRRNPDLKWRQTPADVDEMTRKQASILSRAARLLRPGGRLVYATCSLLPEENENVVAAFLDARPDFAARDADAILAARAGGPATGTHMRLAPHVHGTDGFFAAVLERNR